MEGVGVTRVSGTWGCVLPTPILQMDDSHHLDHFDLFNKVWTSVA